MAALDTNRILPILAAVSVVGAAILVFVASRDDARDIAEGGRPVAVDAPREADADNTADTIRALSGLVTELRQEVEATRARAETLEAEQAAEEAEAETARAEAEAATESRIAEITDAANARSERLLAELETMQETIQSLGERVEAAEAVPPEEPESRMNLMLEDGEDGLDSFDGADILPGLGLDALAGGEPLDGNELLGVVWVNPLDRPDAATPGGPGEAGEGSGLDALGERFGGRRASADENEDPMAAADAAVEQREAALTTEGVERFYTLPDLSALTGATALTSLVGRIYFDDEIVDPWPFKIMVGRENLAANDTDLPLEIDGMLYEGYAIGDWALGCARGWVTAASFVFEDGTTVAAYADNPGARPEDARYNDDAIGYLSDEYGNPCVAGQKITDAPQFLAGRSLAAGLAGYATALNAEDEITQSVVNPDGSVSTVTSVLEGSRDYAANVAFAEAFAEGARWIRERQRQSFDAVYVEPGREVIVNLQSAIWIDKRPEARQVRYARTGGQHDELD